MTQSTRQRNLFAAEDFHVVYESFRQANFKAYDYDTIRGALVDYIQSQYPENFNDWIQSSEFVALIETLAFLAHSLAFRIDQTGRENFLSTAERRDSVLRIADFLGYTPTRHLPARGELKIVSVKTTQDVYDVNGSNLKNKVVRFEDQYQSFLLVLNEALSQQNKFGRPSKSMKIGNVKTDIYSTNISSDRDVVFSFSGKVNGTSCNFEIHGLEIDAIKQVLQESEPNPQSKFNIIYKNDGQGLGSPHTGFFVGFKQGNLQYNDINADNAISNLVVDLGAQNVNNNDIWVQTIDNNGKILYSWTKVDNGFGANTIFNNIRQDKRKIYSVKTVDNDNVNIQFGDGVFAEIPRGIIRIWYRTGLNQTYTLDPQDLGTVTFSFKYNATDGNTYTISFSCELQEPVTNASAQESVTSIKNNAGRVFAAQDRMITADDYSVYPLTVGENILKIKAVNRTYAGHSRFIKANDPTATYQSVDMIADDGYIYTEGYNYRATVDLPTNLSIDQIYERYIADLPEHPEIMNLFYEKYSEQNVDFSDVAGSYEWQQITSGYRGSTGYLTKNGVIQKLGKNSINDLNAARPGSIVEFVASPYNSGTLGNVGDKLTIVNGGQGYTSAPTIVIRGTGTGAAATAVVSAGQIVSVTLTNGGSGYMNPVVIDVVGGGGSGAVISATAKTAEKTWARVVDIVNDGQGLFDGNGNPLGLTARGQGAVILSKAIPNTARVSKIFPAFNTSFSVDEKNQILDELALSNSFGLRYDTNSSSWKIIKAGDLAPLNQSNPSYFSLAKAGNTSNNNLDQSWIIRVDYTASSWKITSRRIRYVIGSDEKIRFYNQNGRKKFNSETNKPERDRIVVSRVNTQPNGSQFSLGVDSTFYAYKYYTETDGYTDDRKVIVTLSDIDNDRYPDNPLSFKTLVGNEYIELGTITDEDGYSYTVRKEGTGNFKPGRKNLIFNWKRVSDSNYRIDPSLSNVIDVYVLNQNYDTKYREWLSSVRDSAKKPTPPNEIELEKQFAQLNKKKAISDTIVYRPAEYKVLFGEMADLELQGKFKVVKISGTSLTDNEIKTRILKVINDFFNIENWDFGETFYFTELSAYIHQQLPGVISSIVLVPNSTESQFGDLFQITPHSNELFIPDVSIQDIEIVSSLSNI